MYFLFEYLPPFLVATNFGEAIIGLAVMLVAVVLVLKALVLVYWLAAKILGI